MTRTESAFPARLIYGLLPLMVAFFGFVTAPPVWSLPADREQPMTITADQGNFSSGRGEATFTGNVYLNQGTLEVWADTLDVRRDPQTGEITFLEARGQPARYQELPNREDGLIEVSGRRIEYRPQDELIITEGDGQLSQAGSDIRAEFIRYNLLDESLDVRSQSSGNQGEDVPQATWTLQPGAID